MSVETPEPGLPPEPGEQVWRPSSRQAIVEPLLGGLLSNAPAPPVPEPEGAREASRGAAYAWALLGLVFFAASALLQLALH